MADAPNEEQRPGNGGAANDSSGPAPETTGNLSADGAESYGGDSDAGPSVTEEELERGLKRDQAEG
jgi:hypothetical protein